MGAGRADRPQKARPEEPIEDEAATAAADELTAAASPTAAAASPTAATTAIRGRLMGPPTNLLGLVLFVGLIVPGFAYLSARDTLAAERHRSPLRELAAVVMVSIACDVLAAGLFGAWRAAAPGTSLDLGGLVRGGGAFAELHYLSVAVHAMAFVLVASLLGALAGLAVGRRTSVGSRAIVPASGWTRAFSLHADSWKELHCELQDGTVVSGILYSWAPEVEEVDDRSLVLSAPIAVRRPGADAPEPWHIGSVIIGAGQVKLIGVAYLGGQPSEDPGGQAPVNV